MADGNLGLRLCPVMFVMRTTAIALFDGWSAYT